MVALLVVSDALRFLRGRTGAFLLLVVLAGVGELAFAVLPVYVAHYRFKDEVVQLASAATNDDAGIRNAILRAAERLRIPLQDERLDVRLEGHERTVLFRYEVAVALLPSLAPRPLRFEARVVQPAFARDPSEPPN